MSRLRWCAAALAAALVLSAYAWLGYGLFRGAYWLLNRAGASGW